MIRALSSVTLAKWKLVGASGSIQKKKQETEYFQLHFNRIVLLMMDLTEL